MLENYYISLSLGDSEETELLNCLSQHRGVNEGLSRRVNFTAGVHVSYCEEQEMRCNVYHRRPYLEIDWSFGTASSLPVSRSWRTSDASARTNSGRFSIASTQTTDSQTWKCVLGKSGLPSANFRGRESSEGLQMCVPI